MALALPSRPSSSLITGALVVGFVFYVAAKGTLSSYISILFGTVQAAQSTTAPAGSTGVDTVYTGESEAGSIIPIPGSGTQNELGQFIPIPPLDSGNQDFSGGVQ
jgi:hypothetical protein